MAEARRELAEAEKGLEMASGSCVVACRALGSMDSATRRLCDLASAPEETRMCTESKSQLAQARARVREACGSCPAGPTVGPAAPVPSP
jgi:hypothetical protein